MTTENTKIKKADLLKRIELLEDRVDELVRHSIKPIPFPILPVDKKPLGNSCPTCGITLTNVMAYSCSRALCPTGLGTTWCSGSER